MAIIKRNLGNNPEVIKSGFDEFAKEEPWAYEYGDNIPSDCFRAGFGTGFKEGIKYAKSPWVKLDGGNLPKQGQLIALYGMKTGDKLICPSIVSWWIGAEKELVPFTHYQLITLPKE
jgi:hypothetical protein